MTDLDLTEAATLKDKEGITLPDALLAEGIDWRRRDAPAFETWAEVDQALAFWANRACTRLEARTGAP